MKSLEKIHKKFNTLASTFSNVSPRFSPSLKSPTRSQIRNIVGSITLQTKLKLGSPENASEREADRIARAIVNNPEKQIHRKSEEEEEKLIQVKALSDQTSLISHELEQSISQKQGSGRQLEERTQSRMEKALGADFSNVRVHTDKESDLLNKQLCARAFTTGKDIFFRKGEYNPGNAKGDELIAHELVHARQQSKNPETAPIIQCWGPENHYSLTIAALGRIFKKTSDFELDQIYANMLAVLSTKMDLKLPELVFNIGAKEAASEYENEVAFGDETEQRKKLNKKERLQRLQDHYAGNPKRASHHGEGGLYSKSYSEARYINTITIKQYLDKVSSGSDIFHSLGDALHIAQDRCSHGEGAVGKGHAWEIISGKNPDNENDNREGWSRAQKETEWVLRLAAPYIRDSLNKNPYVKGIERDIRVISEIPGRLQHFLTKDIRNISDIPSQLL